jgi:taurine dioxygenase
MKYKIHENGWTVILDDFDFKSATQQDINQIAKLIATNTLVIAKGQNLTLEDEVRIAKMFKNPQPLFQPTDTPFQDVALDPEGLVLRVTAAKNERGKTGVGAKPEFEWHANQTFDRNRLPIIWLYSIKGSKGSITSYSNTIPAWEQMEPNMKELVKTLKIQFESNTASSHDTPESWKSALEENFQPDVVHTNIAGKEGLFFSHLDIKNFVGMSIEESLPIIKEVSEYLLQDKFVYHHHWDDGDIVIAEQWLGLHKRWAFDKLEDRLLHRIAIDFPNQDYK